MALQDYDVFSRCHPAVNFLFFAAAIVLTVVLFHPAYLLVSLVCGGAYYAAFRRIRCGKTLGFLLLVLVLVAAVNPIFNTLGDTVLFTLFGRPYTWQALCYGLCSGLMFAAVSLWFLCGGIVMTSDKFTSLFGAVIPSISLVLVMVLRLIPGYWRKGRQIAGARKCIGRSAAGTRKEKIQGGMDVLTALSGWALEGSVVTADSMRCRGCSLRGRTAYSLYRFDGRDRSFVIGLCSLICVLLMALLLDQTMIRFAPQVVMMPITPMSCLFYAAWAALCLLPPVLELLGARRFRHLQQAAL